jgi:hypothetical protein
LGQLPIQQRDFGKGKAEPKRRDRKFIENQSATTLDSTMTVGDNIVAEQSNEMAYSDSVSHPPSTFQGIFMRTSAHKMSG